LPLVEFYGGLLIKIPFAADNIAADNIDASQILKFRDRRSQQAAEAAELQRIEARLTEHRRPEWMQNWTE